MSKLDHLNYTPVNKETFSKWCAEFMEKLKEQEENMKTEQDMRLTGRELFMEGIDNIELGDIEDALIPKEEESKIEEEMDDDLPDDEDGPVAPLYDKDLFAQELAAMEEKGEEFEDVDFD